MKKIALLMLIAAIVLVSSFALTSCKKNQPDVNIDTDGDGTPDVNIDTDGDEKPDVNVDTDGDEKPDVNIDTDGDKKPDDNLDSDGDGTPDDGNLGLPDFGEDGIELPIIPLD